MSDWDAASASLISSKKEYGLVSVIRNSCKAGYKISSSFYILFLSRLLYGHKKNDIVKHLICVDARPLAYTGNGNARYLYNMLREIIRLQPDDHWLLISHKAIHPDMIDILLYPNVASEIDTSWTRYAGPLWLHFRLPQLLKKYKADLFWATLAAMPVWYSKRCKGIPSIVNFHDLNARSAPKTMTFWNYIQHRIMDFHSLKQADRIICLSETTRNHIMHYYPGITADLLKTVYPGVDLTKSQKSKKPYIPPALSGRKFILSVGTIEPRKNFRTLIEGYRLARSLITSADFPFLLITGRKGWGEESLYKDLKNNSMLKDSVCFLEGISDEELNWCYENAVFAANPSLHEGFGLPVIEAAVFGIPLLLSDIEIYREIAGKNAAYCEPLSAEKWADMLISMNEAVKKGKANILKIAKKEWTWKNRASQISSVIAELLQ
jgi:glycosyltransferase involved in cell wall biosynthesis